MDSSDVELMWSAFLAQLTCPRIVDLHQPMGVILGTPYAHRLKSELVGSALPDVVRRAKPEDSSSRPVNPCRTPTNSCRALRDRIDGVYQSTTFVADPSSEVPLHLFAPTFLDRFQIIRPSPPDEPGTPVQSAPPTPDETATLVALATAYRRVEHPLSPNIVPVATVYHSRACRRAAGIAEFLEWRPAEPVEKWCCKVGVSRMREAEAARAKIVSCFISNTADGAWVGEGQRLWRPLGPGEWLAEA
ncbi:hypothetical protein C8J57DRAFT_1586696 [Mycena rebaudengoi]|nr:hypothetical protein C8J57DRAFT_1586696 [Mycena rebaudengoi]